MIAIIAFLLFIAAQIGAALLCLLFPNNAELAASNMAIALLALSSLLSAGLWVWLRKHPQPLVSSHAQQRAPLTWQRSVGAIVGALFLGFGLSFMIEQMPFAADDAAVSELFQAMLQHPLGWILICLIGPLTEELVFRASIIPSLCKNGLPPRLAAAISALAFALVHGNWVQGIPAACIGYVFGLFYLRTGNLRLCLTAHIANNTLAALLIQQGNPTLQSWVPSPIAQLSLIVLLMFSSVALIAWSLMSHAQHTAKPQS